MKTMTRSTAAVLVLFVASASSSCPTPYDASGRPVQSVDPGAAAAGAVAAGALGYAIGKNNDDRDYYYHRRPYYRPYGYRRHRYHHGRYGYWHR